MYQRADHSWTICVTAKFALFSGEGQQIMILIPGFLSGSRTVYAFSTPFQVGTANNLPVLHAALL